MQISGEIAKGDWKGGMLSDLLQMYFLTKIFLVIENNCCIYDSDVL